MYTIELYQKDGIKEEEAPDFEAARRKMQQHVYKRGHDFGSCKLVGDIHYLEFWSESANEKSRELMGTITEGIE